MDCRRVCWSEWGGEEMKDVGEVEECSDFTHFHSSL